VSKRLKVNFICAPGDIVACTAALRDYALAFPDTRIVYCGAHKELLANNPHVEIGSGACEVTLCYAEGQRRVADGRWNQHFISWFYEDIYRKTGRQFRMTRPTPALYLPLERRVSRPVEGRYWLMMAGGKTDMPVKHWEFDRYKELATRLRELGIATVQSGAAHDIHPDANCDLNLVGWGGLSELMWQVYHADGIICPITCAMHMAAAFNKPCVVLAGGREDPCWEAYNNEYNQFEPGLTVTTPHRYLNRVGSLECCKTHGCWVRKLSGKEEPSCRDVVRGKQPLPRCMADITVEHVVAAVQSYYHDRTIPAPVYAGLSFCGR